MPKEVIHDDAPLPGRENSTPLAIEVGWGRDTHVQIATVNMEKEPYSPEAGWFIDLDRSRINRLIRALRKARDQAFGEDA